MEICAEDVGPPLKKRRLCRPQKRKAEPTPADEPALKRRRADESDDDDVLMWIDPSSSEIVTRDDRCPYNESDADTLRLLCEESDMDVSDVVQRLRDEGRRTDDPHDATHAKKKVTFADTHQTRTFHVADAAHDHNNNQDTNTIVTQTRPRTQDNDTTITSSSNKKGDVNDNDDDDDDEDPSSMQMHDDDDRDTTPLRLVATNAPHDDGGEEPAEDSTMSTTPTHVNHATDLHETPTTRPPKDDKEDENNDGVEEGSKEDPKQDEACVDSHPSNTNVASEETKRRPNPTTIHDNTTTDTSTRDASTNVHDSHDDIDRYPTAPETSSKEGTKNKRDPPSATLVDDADDELATEPLHDFNDDAPPFPSCRQSTRHNKEDK